MRRLRLQGALSAQPFGYASQVPRLVEQGVQSEPHDSGNCLTQMGWSRFSFTSAVRTTRSCSSDSYRSLMTSLGLPFLLKGAYVLS